MVTFSSMPVSITRWWNGCCVSRCETPVLKAKSPRVSTFGLAPGSHLAGKYQVVSRIGSGWEGEVYLVREIGTRIDRTVKIFFPRRNPSNRALRFYARKLHKLRHCPVVIQYHTRDIFDFNGIMFLVELFKASKSPHFLPENIWTSTNSVDRIHKWRVLLDYFDRVCWQSLSGVLEVFRIFQNIESSRVQILDHDTWDQIFYCTIGEI